MKNHYRFLIGFLAIVCFLFLHWHELWSINVPLNQVPHLDAGWFFTSFCAALLLACIMAYATLSGIIMLKVGKYCYEI